MAKRIRKSWGVESKLAKGATFEVAKTVIPPTVIVPDWMEKTVMGRRFKRKKKGITFFLLRCKDGNWDGVSGSSGRAFAHVQGLFQRCRADDT